MGEPADSEELQDLERRIAAFTSATQRLANSVKPTPAMPEDPPTPPPTPAALTDEPISGLRPAVATPMPVTGALTARHRGDTAKTFTSSHGRPQLAVQPASTPPSTRTPVAPPSRWRRWRWGVVAALAALPLLALIATARFPVLPEATVVARMHTVTASHHGVLQAVLRPMHAAVRTGEPLLQMVTEPGGNDPPHTILSPVDGQVVALHLSAGRQVEPGQKLADIALPGTARVVARLPESLLGNVGRGDRCQIRLIGENQVVHGTVAAVVPAGDPGDDLPAVGYARLVVALDPSPRSPQPGLGATVVVLGPDPGPLRLLQFRLKQLLP